MGVYIDLTGRRYGELLVLSPTENSAPNKTNPHGRRQFLCRCSCGKTLAVRSNGLRSGNTTSCGCVRQQKNVDRLTIHGQSHLPEYHIWKAMKARCTRPTSASYPRYGGRGIRVCDRWLADFTNFWEDMGPRPEGASIDRIDVNGNYEPSNCRWATDDIQRRNKRIHSLVCQDCSASFDHVESTARFCSRRCYDRNKRAKVR